MSLSNLGGGAEQKALAVAGNLAEDRSQTAPVRTRAFRVVFFNRSYYPDFGATGQLLVRFVNEAPDSQVGFGFQVALEGVVE